ncbi:MAG: HicA toxin of bacterial toxin-antitoxin [Thermoplasmata archaeon]|nr:HicA toxin of bacterial toxin-antitoxin [Thermoplasmata archaeon]
MPKLPRDVTHDRLVRFLRRHDWVVAREGGRHTIVSKAGVQVAVPRHAVLKVGTLAAILRQTGPWDDETLRDL